MYLKILLVVVAVAAQRTAIDPWVLDEIFGPRPTTTANRRPTVVSTQKLEEITIKPTDITSQFVDDNGDACHCVPYYLCDLDHNAVDVTNSSVTGYGELDVRFREEGCQESTELCCKNSKKEDEVTTPPTPATPRGCGYRNPGGIDFTIKGGTGHEAGFGEFPWVVAVLDTPDNSYVGVGVLIHPQVVMTGGHVVFAYRYTAGRLKIRAGEWDTQTIKERLKYQERVVQDVYLHSGFQRKTLRNDMALLRLQQPLQLAEHINVICMPGQGEGFDQHRGCVANGWGKSVFGGAGRYAVILKRVEVDMVPHARCNALLKRALLKRPRPIRNFSLHNSFVCAGGAAGQDTCQGDGGAPLACPVGNDRYKLAGLVAWGLGCGERDVPAVYAAVAKFRTWVDSKMAGWGLDTSAYSI